MPCEPPGPTCIISKSPNIILLVNKSLDLNTMHCILLIYGIDVLQAKSLVRTTFFIQSAMLRVIYDGRVKNRCKKRNFMKNGCRFRTFER